MKIGAGLLTAITICPGLIIGRESLLLVQVAPPVALSASAGSAVLDRSYAVVFVDKTGLGHQHAVVGRLSEGYVRLGAARGAARLVFDVGSFVADTAEARRYLKLEAETDASTQKQITANLLGKDVLDAATYTAAPFDIEAATPRVHELSRQGNPHYVLQGQFTLHGVTRPLAVKAEVVDGGRSLRLRGAFHLRQTDYGIKPFPKAFDAVGVADPLTVYGEISLAK